MAWEMQGKKAGKEPKSADLTIKQLAKQSYQNSADHGFWDSPHTPETIPNKLMLIVSELAEALESYRDPESDNLVKVPVSVIETLLRGTAIEGDPTDEVDYPRQVEAWAELANIYDKWKAKPKGFNTEIADAFIRLGDLVGAFGIDIETAIQEKHEFNKGRPRMHGRKV